MRTTDALTELHPTDDTLELYSLGHLPKARLSCLEEHLLVCPGCQDRLAQIEDYIDEIKTVCAEAENVDADKAAAPRFFARLFQVPALVWVGAAAALTIVTAVPTFLTTSGPVPETEVRLVAARGVAEAAVETRGNLRLDISSSQLIPFASYRVKVVSGSGREIWQSEAAPHLSDLSVRLPMRLDPGSYWVRVSGPLGEPAGEFALYLK